MNGMSEERGTRKRFHTDSANIDIPLDIDHDAGISTSEYARKRRELMELIKDLRDMGSVSPCSTSRLRILM